MLAALLRFQVLMLLAAKTIVEHGQQGMFQTWSNLFLTRWMIRALSGADVAVMIAQIHPLQWFLHAVVKNQQHANAPLRLPSA